jgi:predicted glutamine amidotransferase
MCVACIIYSKESLEHFQMMEKSNPHGAGVAWVDTTRSGARKVFFQKGLTAQDIFNLQEDGTLTFPYLAHFRWATHGPKVPELTHPFPLGGDALFPDCEGEVDSALIHNGVWYSYKHHLPAWLKDSKYDKLVESLSDTQLAAYLAKDNPAILDDIDWATSVMSVGPEGEACIASRGRWYKLWDNYYSNHNWCPHSDMPKNWWDKGVDAKPPGYVPSVKRYTPTPNWSPNSGSYTAGNHGKSGASGNPYFCGYDWEGEGEKEKTDPEGKTYGSYGTERSYSSYVSDFEARKAASRSGTLPPPYVAPPKHTADKTDYELDGNYWVNDGKEYAWDPTQEVTEPPEVEESDIVEEVRVSTWCDGCAWAIDQGYDDCGSKWCRKATARALADEKAKQLREKHRLAKIVESHREVNEAHLGGKPLSWEEYISAKYGDNQSTLKIVDDEDGEVYQLTTSELEEFLSYKDQVSEDPAMVNRYLDLARGITS